MYLVHPVSRALVTLLIRTPVTPNQVSVASVAMAGAAALCYAQLAWPLNAFAGLAFQFAWHVLDGADGDLARRTGRASTVGELVDGICDHASQGLIYLAFAIILSRAHWPVALGSWAWAVAAAGALSHFIQANAFETGRKGYRRWVYGATWIRQDLTGAREAGPVQRLLGEVYLRLSRVTDPGGGDLEAKMSARTAAGAQQAQAARRLYRETYAPLVARSAALSGNSRTVAAFLCLLAGSPLWYFAFEVTALNAVLAALILARARRNARLATALRAVA